MTSATHSPGEVYDVASTIVGQKLAQVQGVGQVTVGGGSLPAVRVELDPLALAHAGLSPEQVRAAIASANVDRPKGAVEDGSRRWQILASDQARTAADYLPTIVAYQAGAAVRLADVAKVSDSVQDTRNSGLANGKPAILLILNRQPNANIVDTVARVRDVLKEALEKALDLSCFDVEALRLLLSAERSGKREPSETVEIGALRS